MTLTSLTALTGIAGLPPLAADQVEIDGVDPSFPMRYRVVAPGAAAMAATGYAASELWALRTGRTQKVRLTRFAAATALRSSRYLRINGAIPKDPWDTITGFYQLKNGRLMDLHCNFFNLRARNSANGLTFQGIDQKPQFLPVSAQDYIAGYLLAFGTMVALARRAREGGSWLVRTSLAGAGHWIRSYGLVTAREYGGVPEEFSADDLRSLVMESDSPVGRLTHLKPAVQMPETPPRWDRPAVPLGFNPPQWPARAS